LYVCALKKCFHLTIFLEMIGGVFNYPLPRTNWK
jgi:hypothetical protein